MKKSNTIDLKSLWQRAAKAQKPNSKATPCSQVMLSVESTMVEGQGQSNSPIGLEPQLIDAAPNTEDDAIPITENDRQPSTENASTDHEIESPITLPPITEDNESTHESDSESDDGATYDVDLLERDPGLRLLINDYHVNDKNAVRRGYIALGPCQPREHDFPRTKIGTVMRKFSVRWYKDHDWLEYSVADDAVFCFVCFLFKDEECAGGEAFVNRGFRSWNTKDRLKKHVGAIDSAHNKAQEKYNNFVRPRASIGECYSTISSIEKVKYRSRLTFSLQCLRFILGQGLACRGHDESDDSLNGGNFRELLKWLAQNFEEVDKVVLKNAPKNAQMTSPTIQKDLINSCAKETTSLIMQDLGEEFFSILADESSDFYHNEQLALCLRYVDKNGRVIERFLGIVHVENTAAITLRDAIKSLLMKHSLSLSRVRGQGYDGASNMKGHIGGLKKLIMDESPSAYYVHCFAHQLQLTLVAVAKENQACISFFEQLRFLLSIIVISCKKIKMLREAQAQQILEALDLGEFETGIGMNQEMGLGRPCDTRWNSHHKTVMHTVLLYPTIRNVLIMVGDDHSQGTEAVNAQTMLAYFESFEFVFMAHLLLAVFGYTNNLSNALQRKDQNIVNAIDLFYLTKAELADLREDDGWAKFLQQVIAFCVKHEVDVPNMDSCYEPIVRSKRYVKKISYLHRFRVEIFLCVIDRQLQELNDRFDEVNTELLICMAAFNPANLFAAYNEELLLKLAEFYPMDFSSNDIHELTFDLRLYIREMRKNRRFSNIKNLGDLSVTLVKTGKSTMFPYVYKLLKLVLVLPVATASVERVFSAMNYVKNKLRSKMGDQLLNDCLITFIEREFFKQVNDDAVIARFQAMKERVVKLY
ncbi:hypothetical protein ACP70R_002023 [Stipagrostis hirtigluma subsp. patula]